MKQSVSQFELAQRQITGTNVFLEFLIHSSLFFSYNEIDRKISIQLLRKRTFTYRTVFELEIK